MKKTPYYQTKIDIVTKGIRESILKGDLKPKDRIQIKHIAKEFGISTIPIREALRRLEVEGLLEIRPHYGTYVLAPDINMLPDIFEVRILLESRATKLAAERITDSELQRLRLINLEMDRLSIKSNQSSVKKYFELNRKFHGMIYRYSGRPFLCKVIDNIRMSIEPYLLAYMAFSENLQIAQKDHKKILMACEQRNGQLAEDAIAMHLERIATTLMELIKPNLEAKFNHKRNKLNMLNFEVNRGVI